MKRRFILVGLTAFWVASLSLLRGSAHAAYRGANGWVAIASTRAGGNFQLYIIDPDGSNAERLTHSGGSDVEPAWSPDGRRLVFDSTRGGNRDIYVINADGTGERRLTFDPAIDILVLVKDASTPRRSARAQAHRPGAHAATQWDRRPRGASAARCGWATGVIEWWRSADAPAAKESRPAPSEGGAPRDDPPPAPRDEATRAWGAESRRPS